MKAQTLVALATALASSFCNAATFAKPFNIDFYQKDKGSYSWTDLTHTEPFGTTIPDGTSPSEKDPSFLGHFRFNSTDDVKRTFHWRLKGVHEITCDVVVSGDPGVANVIYHVDTRKFEVHDGEKPNLSVVHVRCRLPLKRGQFGDPDFGFDDPTFNPNDSSYGLDDDLFNKESNFTKVEPPDLHETDLEQVLNVIFQISGQPITRADLPTIPLNTDFWWNPSEDKSMSRREVDYEAYKSSRAISTYNFLRKMAVKPNAALTDVETSLDEKSEYQWYGEVGRMVFSKAGMTARDFTWFQHHDPNNPKVQKKCHLQINHDPHTAVLYVNLTANPPEISLQGEDTGLQRGDGDGDPSAASILCDKEVTDDGASISIAPNLDQSS